MLRKARDTKEDFSKEADGPGNEIIQTSIHL